ncbi:hypothetical protein BD626DRAFT_479200 [Schizophyllum amplum]|uniref:Uncharacterized protein n=1 Tax=Schizophyllum amplum TaxID=97359 RepID=A0A550CS15_9AGAR|nr:hypothetical protein BD626DRAFT_479200 [Auriculariopsis ampla]
MPLFRDHPVRSTAGVVIALAIAHTVARFISSTPAFHFTQATLAVLAILGMMVLVTLHHRQEGHLLTQNQEEMMLIGGFGLFWLAAYMGWRAMRQRSGGDALAESSSGGAVGSGGGSGRWPYPCSSNDIYCIVEEYAYY